MKDLNESIIKHVCKIINEEKYEENNLKITGREGVILFKTLLEKYDLEESIKNIKAKRKEKQKNEYIYPKYEKYHKILSHDGPIGRLCFDNSSRYAFSGGSDGIVKIWNLEMGMVIRSLYGHSTDVTDICISKDGKYMISGDSQGIINIWCLKTFKIIHTLDLGNEILLCEFYIISELYEIGENEVKIKNNKIEVNNEMNENKIYNFSCILTNGLMQTFRFNKKEIISKNINNFMEGENIRAICITDGGRFVICTGRSNCTVLYDTCDLKNIVAFENIGMQNLCAGKGGLKIAGSLDNNVYIYTFFSEEYDLNINFVKRKKGKDCWKKSKHQIPIEHFYERICFLASFLLVTLSSDGSIRIYDDEDLILIHKAEIGSLYAHPNKNIFAVIGEYLRIYELPEKECNGEFSRYDAKYTENEGKIELRLLFEEEIYFGITDSQFSNNGRFFITSDDRGYITTYSTDKPIDVPKDQFFKNDFINMRNINLTEESEYLYDEVFNGEGRRINTWKKCIYKRTKLNGVIKMTKLESSAAKQFEREKLSQINFTRKYLITDYTTDYAFVSEHDEEDEAESSDNKTSNSDDSLDSIDTSSDDSIITSEESEYSVRSSDETTSTKNIYKESLMKNDTVNNDNFTIRLRSGRVISNVVETERNLFEENNHQNKLETVRRPRRRAAQILSSDSEEETARRPRRRAAQILSDNSEEENVRRPRRRAAQILSSDSEEENVRRPRRRAAQILSDNSEEETVRRPRRRAALVFSRRVSNDSEEENVRRPRRRAAQILSSDSEE